MARHASAHIQYQYSEKLKENDKVKASHIYGDSKILNGTP